MKSNFTQDIPLLKNKIYLSNCERAPLHQQVFAGVQQYLNWGESGAWFWEALQTQTQELKVKLAQLLNCKPQEIALFPNTAVGLSAIAAALNYQSKRNEIIVSNHDFPNTRLVFTATEKWGSKVRLVDDFDSSLKEYQNYLSTKTLLIAKDLVCFQRGEISAIDKLLAMAQANDAHLLVNGSLGVGALPIDLKQTPLTFFVGNTSKYLMGGPGLCFIYCAQEVLAQLKPAITGWWAQQFPFDLNPRSYELKTEAAKLQGGTLPLINLFAANQGLDLILTQGVVNIYQQRQALFKNIEPVLTANNFPPLDENKLFYSFYERGAKQIRKRLLEKDIVTSCVNDYFRIAPHYYNTEAELLTALEAIKPLLSSRSSSSKFNHQVLPLRKEAALVLRNLNIVEPDRPVYQADIACAEGEIKSIGQNLNLKGEVEYDLKDKYALAGIIDPHIHLGLFASLEEELKTETQSALMGGITTAGWFIGGNDSHLKRLNQIEELTKEHALIDLKPHLVITQAEHLAELPHYINKGLTSFKMYMCGIEGLIPSATDGFIYDMMLKLKQYQKNTVLCLHAENADLVEWATAQMKQQGYQRGTLKDWAKTHPNLAEGEAVNRAIYLNQALNIPLYFVHLSSKEGVMALQKGRRDYPQQTLYGETTPFYLTCNNEVPCGLLAKMIPPLREQASVDYLWESLKNNIIDTIGTDNTTQDLQVKNLKGGLWETMPGYPAMATSLALMLHYGVNQGRISLQQVAQIMSKGPAQIFNMYPQQGSLTINTAADITIVDLNKEKLVQHSQLKSRADFSIFEGQLLKGWPEMTVKDGTVLMYQDQILNDSHRGKLLYK